MKRRDYLKTIILGSAILYLSNSVFSKTFTDRWPYPVGVEFQSEWQNWPDMKWVGPEYWGNRLQDWTIKGGKAVCGVTAPNRNLHLLPIQMPEKLLGFNTSVKVSILNNALQQLKNGCYGIRLGAKGPVDDYRSAAVFGVGTDIGLDHKGNLVIGEETILTNLGILPEEFVLLVKAKPLDDNYLLEIQIIDSDTGKILFSYNKNDFPKSRITGNFALVAHSTDGSRRFEEDIPSVAFEEWSIRSEELTFNDAHFFGPICFAQYTLNRKKLKLTAQLAPVEQIEGHQVRFEIKENNSWQTLQKTDISHEGRAINFTIDDWVKKFDVPYRIVLSLPIANKVKEYIYEGTVAEEPIHDKTLKTAVFSCNFHYGFPDSDILQNVGKLAPDVILFLGDQFYEGTGGFGAVYKGDYDKSCLDYLRKWYMFGWSYRELFRHRPCAIIPDDHDVYHGNIWGESGREADTSNGFGASAQDSGGYKMPADWVNMVQFTQTSHLPDAFDPTPVKQGIGVYYAHWNYAGISFAILEDRKFKSAPKHILPREAQVENGWIMADDFDIKKYKNLEADLLGERQEHFLETWVGDWSESAEMKVVLSQTNFATVATLPEGAKTGAVIPSLDIPEKGEYIKGDLPTVDMDSNGWPSLKRDKAVEIIRKGFAFHIAGDQHLASFVQYGVKAHGDSGFAFAGPALNNIWPRRFWPDVDSLGHTYENPAYTGKHIDGFGNKMTVLAVANPHKNHKEPAILHDRAVGYGLVTFNKENRTIKTQCWPRFVDPTAKENKQYPGFPITILQEDNYGREAVAWLPGIKLKGNQKPTITIFDENNVMVYSIRMGNSFFKPKVFKKGYYTIFIKDDVSGFEKKMERVKAKAGQRRTIELDLEKKN